MEFLKSFPLTLTRVCTYLPEGEGTKHGRGDKKRQFMAWRSLSVGPFAVAVSGKSDKTPA